MDSKKTVLFIEDDIDLIEAMKVALGENKYNFLSAYDPEEGFQQAKSKKPDIIILDVMFGNKEKTTGFDYAVKFRRESGLSAVPILMVTAVNAEHPGFHFSANKESEYLPVDAFLDKPAQPEELAEKVELLLKKGESKWANWPEMN